MTVTPVQEGQSHVPRPNFCREGVALGTGILIDGEASHQSMRDLANEVQIEKRSIFPLAFEGKRRDLPFAFRIKNAQIGGASG